MANMQAVLTALLKNNRTKSYHNLNVTIVQEEGVLTVFLKNKSLLMYLLTNTFMQKNRIVVILLPKNVPTVFPKLT